MLRAVKSGFIPGPVYLRKDFLRGFNLAFALQNKSRVKWSSTSVLSPCSSVYNSNKCFSSYQCET